MTEQEMQARIEHLDREIAAYPHWGAVLTAWDEERRSLISNLAYLRRNQVQRPCDTEGAA